MKKDDKRFGKSSGVYATHTDLVEAVLALKRGNKITHREISERCGISTATLVRIIKEQKGERPPVVKNLNAMLNSLWRVTS